MKNLDLLKILEYTSNLRNEFVIKMKRWNWFLKQRNGCLRVCLHNKFGNTQRNPQFEAYENAPEFCFEWRTHLFAQIQQTNCLSHHKWIYLQELDLGCLLSRCNHGLGWASSIPNPRTNPNSVSLRCLGSRIDPVEPRTEDWTEDQSA